MGRKSWNEYFMDIAFQVAERSTCDRLHVGCVIVKDNRIISTGYNGSIHGEDHCDDVGHMLNDQGRCIRTIHAEQNAILHAERDELKGAVVYVTHCPCETCTKLLSQSGVNEVIYKIPYRSHPQLFGKTKFIEMKIKSGDENNDRDSAND